MIPVPLAPASRFAHAEPVGRLVAGSEKTAALHETLQQHRPVVIPLLPVIGEPSGDGRQNLGGKILGLYLGQDQKTVVVDDTVQLVFAFIGTPADKGVPAGNPPGGGVRNARLQRGKPSLRSLKRREQPGRKKVTSAEAHH